VLRLYIGAGIGGMVSLLAQFRGVMNDLGWSSVVIYLLFALGFGYFQFAKSAH